MQPHLKLATDEPEITKENIGEKAKEVLMLIDNAETGVWESWAEYGFVLVEGKRLYPSNHAFSAFLDRHKLNKLPSGREILPVERAAAIWMCDNLISYVEARKFFPDVTTPRGLHQKWKEAQEELDCLDDEVIDDEVIEDNFEEDEDPVRLEPEESPIEIMICKFVEENPETIEIVIRVLMGRLKSEKSKRQLFDKIILNCNYEPL